MSFGFIEGEGLKSLQLKYFNSPHRAYIESAAIETHSFKDIIENYDTYYKQSSFTFTKPPGVMLMYTAIDRLVNGSNYSIGQDARVAKVSDFIVWAFPLFSFTVVFLLFLFMRKLDGSVDNEIVSLIGAVLFVITPSIDLFVLFADQAIYPFVFL
jgi:hypothetical protein